MTPFGARLRALRAERGINQKALAKRLNVSPAYLSALEHGRRGQPGPGLVLEICGHLDLIWDEAEELKRLAANSRPKVLLDTGGLSPKATELANRLAARLHHLTESEIDRLMIVLEPPTPKNHHTNEN
ncbi:MAG: helix-turn-helix domain-containing protein [Rhodospirillaceae bacterium]